MSAVVKTIKTFEPPLTVEDFERLPDGGGKQELVGGELVEMAPTGGLHGLTQLVLGGLLRQHARRHRLGHTTAETGYRLWPERANVRAPDVAFLSRARWPGRLPDGIVPTPPDLAVEILSPNDRAPEVQAKVREYLDAGVRLVWVVDPRAERVRVYRPAVELPQGGSEEPTRELGRADVLSGEDVLPGFALPLAALFDELAEDGGEDEPESGRA